MKSYLLKLCAFDLILIIARQVSCAPKPKLSSICGDPGRPVGSQITPLQSIYSEGDSVDYKCDDYISIKYTKKCVKGKWIGMDAVCGKSLKNNDLKFATIINKSPNKTIRDYNTTNSLMPFTKFGNSFIAERYAIPLRAYGSKSYVFKLYLQSKGLFELVRLSLSVVDSLINDTIRNSTLNITKVESSIYRKCIPVSSTKGIPWFYNSTRFDYWYHCLSPNKKTFQKELLDMSDTVTIETDSDAILQLDLATFIIAQSYTNNENFLEPICGTPEVPIGLEANVIHHQTDYTFKCAHRFDELRKSVTDNRLVCGINMRWSGNLPQCYPLNKCKEFELNSESLVQIDSYEKVYYHNSTDWFAIEGTVANFRCVNSAHILVGKQTLICGPQNKWSDNIATCYNPYEQSLSINTIIVIGVIILVVVIGLCAVLLYFMVRTRAANSRTVRSDAQRSSVYDDIDLNNTYEDLYSNDKMYAEYYESEPTQTDRDRYQTPKTRNQLSLTKVTYVNTKEDATYINEDIAGAYVTMR